MSAVLTYIGPTLAALRQQMTTVLNRGVIEYVEMWEGKADDSAWPAYNIGDAPSAAGAPTGVKWYELLTETNTHGPLARFTAKASNKFDADKSEWSSTSVAESFGYWTGDAGDIHIAWIYVTLPVVRKVSYHITPPSTGTLGSHEAPGAPFSLPTVQLPTVAGITWQTLEWVKNMDEVSTLNQIYTRTEGWAYTWKGATS